MYQGLFMAPHIVMQAVKTAIYAAAIFQKLGYKVKPVYNAIRHDIIQAITLNTAQNLENFCVAIQLNSPVDSHVTPVPDNIPGYQDKIIMAAGTFVQGASIELSARMIGEACKNNKKKKKSGDVILDGETDGELLRICEEIMNRKLENK